jgi:uncharacterized Zn-binding protein involved in type VI secretion
MIIDGDTHSHGGRVTASSSHAACDGAAYVCEGDVALCHIHGITHVATATSLMWIDERQVALEGDTLACGATLRSSQQHAFSEMA